MPRSGRIVAAAAHAHGGAIRISRGQPLRRADGLGPAATGWPDDPIYKLSPVLHEPAPRSMSVMTSKQGWPVTRATG